MNLPSVNPPPSAATPRTVECFFDIASPASWLAWRRLPALATAAGASVRWRPMLLGGVFKATGNTMPAAVAAKGRWLFADLAEWARRAGVPFAMNPHFPVHTLQAMRVATAVQLAEPARFAPAVEAMFRAVWADGRDLGDAAVLAAVLAEAGLPADTWLAAAAEPATKAALAATTEEAVARGAFGAPTCFVGDRLFFGQDRLDWVAEALAAA